MQYKKHELELSQAFGANSHCLIVVSASSVDTNWLSDNDPKAEITSIRVAVYSQFCSLHSGPVHLQRVQRHLSSYR